MDSANVITGLDNQFGIAGAARIVAGNGGLAKVLISVPGGKGEMYLHGAHVTSWTPSGTGEVLYVSPNSKWQDGQAIRGGVPVCFPWFADRAGDPKAPAHGFVRTKSWQMESIDRSGDEIIASMFTESGEDTRKWWPFDFRIICRATFGAQLKIELVVSNTGTSPFSFEDALHAYFSVGNAETAVIRGLDATDFIDKTDKHTVKRQNGDVRIMKETDSVFLITQREIELFDPTMKRRISIQKQNSLTTVVWNPWVERSRSMGDLGADMWREFVCIETSNTIPCAVTLAPGEQHTLAALIRVGT